MAVSRRSTRSLAKAPALQGGTHDSTGLAVVACGSVACRASGVRRADVRDGSIHVTAAVPAYLVCPKNGRSANTPFMSTRPSLMLAKNAEISGTQGGVRRVFSLN